MKLLLLNNSTCNSIIKSNKHLLTNDFTVSTCATLGVTCLKTDFDVSSGAVTLNTIITGAVLAIAGISNEIETRSNGTVTVGLPSDVTIGRDLTVTRDLTLREMYLSQVI